MRLLLLPISTRRVLIYCEPPSQSLSNTQQQSYVEKAVNYASKTWATWEKSESGWKLKTTQYGNKMLRRIPYEEWGLKSIPALSERRKQEYAENPTKMAVEVVFPGLYQGLVRESVMDVLKRLGNERQGLHKKKLIQSVASMPLTIPFGLIPVVPNLPFFYLAFRAYSHYRALTGSRHLSHLVAANLLRPAPNPALDSLYSAGLLHPTRADSRSAPDPTPEQTEKIAALIRRQTRGGSASDADPASQTQVDVKSSGEAAQGEEEEVMLLKGWNGKLIAERLELPGLEVEIERAVEQVENQLRKGDEPHEEKKEIETAAAGGERQRQDSGTEDTTTVKKKAG